MAGGRKKVHTTWDDIGVEMVEEYDATTDQLLLRKLRKDAGLGSRENKWEIEVGEDSQAAGGDGLLAISSDQPSIFRKDTKDCFQWRVRNIEYPLEVYNITADAEKNEIVVRTNNKKWFKRISIPDMSRMGLSVEQAGIKFTHANRTLVISYTKPVPILEAEAKLRKERAAMKVPLSPYLYQSTRRNPTTSY
eukprot:Tamp_19859.p1 GENE.Tamp_19859~~Tamp_19859.p1  ORF type:complete len:192 (+),score=37.98 Tamp_19859:412-987(+)